MSDFFHLLLYFNILATISTPAALVNKNKIATVQLTDTTTTGHCEEKGTATALDKYIKSIRAMNKRTAREYYLRLISFQDFVISRYKTKITLDNIITRINEGSEDLYEILNDYVSYLQINHNISTLTLKQRVVTVKNFFEYFDIEISPRKFKLKVKLPIV
jgi:hypothetical protein